MSIAKLIKVLADSTEVFDLPTEKLSNLMATAPKDELVKVEAILKDKYNTFKEGDVTVFEPKGPGRLEAAATNIQAEAIAGKTAINLGNVPDPQTKIGADLNTSADVATIVMPEMFRQEMPKLINAQKTLAATVTDAGWTTIPESVSFADKKLGRIDTGIWGDVNKSIGDYSEALVERPTLHLYEEQRLAKVYSEINDSIRKGLTKDEIKTLEDLTDAHDQAGVAEKLINEGFEINGIVHPASRKVQEAIMTQREMFNHSWRVKNAGAVRAAKKDGGMLLDGETIVKPVGRNEVKLGEPIGDSLWTRELRDQGYEVWKSEKKGNIINHHIISPADKASRMTDIPENFKILAYKPGYSPVKYTQPWAITKIRLDDKGRVIASRIATARSRVSATEAIDRVAGQEPGAGYFAHRSFEDGMDLAMENDLPNLIDNFSEAEHADLHKTLTGLGFAEVDVNRLLKFKNFFSHKKDTTMMRRGRRLVDADTLGTKKTEFAAIMPTDQALAHHMQKTASYQAHAEYFKMLEDEFMNTFGEFIEKGGRWSDPISPFNLAKKTKAGKSAREAYIVQAQMKRMEGRLSTFDNMLDDYVQNAADHMLTTPGGKALEGFLDSATKKLGINFDLPTVSQAVAAAKKTTAIAKLGLFNAMQLPMQSTAMLNVLGYSGPHAIKAGADLISVFMAPRLGFGRSKASEELYKLITDSGFVAGLDFTTMADIAKGQSKGIFANNRFVKKLVDSNLMFYQMGEGSVRATAWFAEHHKMVRDINKGVAPFKNADIGSRAYLDEISRRAMKPALNMSRMNQPLIARGLIGMPFQFQQFVIQQANFMFGEMSNLQRAGVFGAWIGSFGIQGIPFMLDALNLSEWGASKVAGPEAYGWWQRTVEDIAGKSGEMFDSTLFEGVIDKQFIKDYFYGGALPAVSDGQISFAHRAGLAKYLSEFFDSAPLGDTLFGPSYKVAASIIGGNIENIKDLIGIIKTDEKLSTNWALQAISKPMEGFSGPSNIMEAIEAWHRGELRDKNLNLITDDPTLADILAMGIGAGIPEQQRRWERIMSSRDRVRVITDYMNKKARRIAEVSVDNPTLGQAMFHEATLQVAQVNPALAPTFVRKATRESLTKNLPAKVREIESTMLRSSKYFSVPEAQAIRETMGREFKR